MLELRGNDGLYVQYIHTPEINTLLRSGLFGNMEV